MNPDGGTTFVVTGKKDFPDVPLLVRFIGDGGVVSVNVSRGATPRELVGTAPSNTVFIGDAGIKVLAEWKHQGLKEDAVRRDWVQRLLRL